MPKRPAAHRVPAQTCRSIQKTPHGVVFAYRNEKSITALPVNIAHPHRALGLLRRSDALRSPVLDAFSAHIRKNFDTLKHTIKRHEQAVVWGG